MKLSEIELDALSEIINIGAGRAANSLSLMTGSRIELTVPNIHVCESGDVDAISKTLDVGLDITIQQGFGGDLFGQALLTFLSGNAIELACIVGDIQGATDELDEELQGILEEIGNLVLNAVLGSISNMLDCGLSYTIPTLCTKQELLTTVIKPDNDINGSNSVILIVDTSFHVASRNISGSLLILFETTDIKVLLSALTSTGTSTANS